MTIEAVTLRVLDDTPAHNPVPGVMVRFYDRMNTAMHTYAVTDDQGEVGLLLLAPGTYKVRYYKDKFTIAQPSTLQVAEAPAVNMFDVYGHVFAPPEATNPRLCRCSGFFKRPDNSPAANHDIHFIPKFDPLLLEGNAMLTERLAVRTDSEGYAQVDLVRFGQYEVTVEGLEDQQRVITIPNLPSVNLCDLLFSVVERIDFSPPGPWTVGIGVDNEITLQVTVRTSDGRVLPGTATQDVQWLVADPQVACVLVAAETIVLRGLAAGTTTLSPARWDQSIVRIPNPPIQGTPVGITVA